MKEILTAFGTITLDEKKDSKLALMLQRGEDVAELEAVCSFIHSGDSVVDAGAYIGSFTLAAEKRGAKVYSFEPNPESYAKLVQNLERNESKATTYNHALGAREGSAGLNINSTNYSNTQLCSGSDIPVKILDSLVEHADFIKIDVEGMEPEVLQGASRLLESKPTLYIEIFERLLGKGIPRVEGYLKEYNLYVYHDGSWYAVPSISWAASVLNPGRFLGHLGCVFNILATTKDVEAKNFFTLIVEKIRERF